MLQKVEHEEKNMKKYYLAYGSNLSVAQMLYRCPDAVYVGAAWLHGYELLFKGSKTGSYLTVEKKKGGMVPLLVWMISEEDEKRLDRYEGYPNFYYKQQMRIKVISLLSRQVDDEVDAIIYIMHEDRLLGCPTEEYYDTCLEGYQRFGFKEKFLEDALVKSCKSKGKAH